MDAQCETEEGFGPQQEDAVTSRTITLNEREFRDVTAALELLIEHDVLLASGPADSFSARSQNCQAILRKLRSAKS
jgi:hypothetical protein